MPPLDTVAAVARMLERRSCASCLAVHLSVSMDVIGEVIERLMRLGLATVEVEQCSWCLHTLAVYRMIEHRD